MTAPPNSGAAPGLSIRRPGLWALPAGALAALGQAPFDLWLLALFGFASGLWLISQAARPGRVAWAFGTGYFAIALHWIVEPFLVEPEIFGWMAPFGLAAMAGGMALFWLAAGWVTARLAPGPGRLWLLVGALALAELARAYLLSGFPWAHPGHILIDTPYLAIAAWIGPHGLTLLVLILAAGAAHLATRRFGLGIVALVALAVFVHTLRPTAPAPGPAADAATVRLIQPNAPQHLKWRSDMIPIFFQRGLDLTSEPGAPDLIVWPETTLPVLLGNSGPWREAIAEAAAGRPVILGAQRLEEGQARNALAVLDAGGEVADLYDKHRLVPFGEYVPLRHLADGIGISGLAAIADGGYWPGAGPAVLDLGPGLGRAFAMICYEAIFPQYLRQVERPDWMIHITNDAWFGTFSGPYQHLALARLRAAESGLPVLRAANTGVSAVLDGRGQIVDSLSLGEAGFLDATLPRALPETLYAQTGDAPLAALALLWCLALFVRLRRKGH